MSVTKDDLVFIDITQEMLSTASYLSTKRELFEFPREGYGDYDSRGAHNIKIGILGELAFLEFALSYLKEKCSGLDANQRHKYLQEKVKFLYQVIIGRYDGGADFQIYDKKIDVKTYDNQTVGVSVDQIFHGLNNNGRPLSLLIDRNQSTKSDLYVQSFVMTNNKICLAGYHIGIPILNNNFRQPAFQCSVPNLNRINEIFEKINL